jgi:circadian clock protein KaiB
MTTGATVPGGVQAAFEASVRGGTTAGAADFYHLRLYVAGASPKSLEAFANLKRLCESHLAGRYEIEVVDLMEHPRLARDEEILAIPPWCASCPEPIRKIIGNLSDTDRVLLNLDLAPEKPLV